MSGNSDHDIRYDADTQRYARWEPRDGSPFHDVRGMAGYEGGDARGLLPTLFGRVTNGISSACMVYAN